MPLPFQEGDSVDEPDLQRLIDQQVVESDTLDLKKGLYGGPPTGWTAGHEFCKDIAALANHRGGHLVIGMDETVKVASALAPLTGDPELEERKLRQWLRRWCVPTPAVTIETVLHGAGPDFFLVITVPASIDQPHSVLLEGDKRPLVVPVRDGADTRYLSEHEIAGRYYQRARAQSDRDRLLDHLVDDGLDRLRDSDTVWLWFAVQPHQPHPRPLTRATAEEVSGWFYSNRRAAPMGTILDSGVPIPGPGCVTFTGYRGTPGVRSAPSPASTYVELHTGGASFTAIDLHKWTGTEDSPGDLGELTLVDAAIAALTSAAPWLHDETGGLGTATVAVGLFNSSGHDHELQLVTRDAGTLARVYRTRALRAAADGQVSRDETIADVAASGDLTGQLILVHDTLSLLLQRFGIPELEHVATDGALVHHIWNLDHRVEQWASNWSVVLR